MTEVAGKICPKLGEYSSVLELLEGPDDDRQKKWMIEKLDD